MNATPNPGKGDTGTFNVKMKFTECKTNPKSTNDERSDVFEEQADFRDAWDPGEKGTFVECHSNPTPSNVGSPHAAAGAGNSRLGRFYRAAKRWVADALVLDMNPTLNDVVLNKACTGKPTLDAKEPKLSTGGSRTTDRNYFSPLPSDKKESHANSPTASLDGHSGGASHLWKANIPSVKQQSFVSSRCNSVNQCNLERELPESGECANHDCNSTLPFKFLGSAKMLGYSGPREAHDFERVEPRSSKQSTIHPQTIVDNQGSDQPSQPANKEVRRGPDLFTKRI